MSQDNVVYLDVETRLDIPVGRVLAGAQEANLADVIIIGREQDGSLYLATSQGDARKFNALGDLAVAHRKMLDIVGE